MNETKRWNILIFGPQGSGKGTQAKILSETLHVPHISPGAMYRQIQEQNTEFAREIKSYLNRGELAPDSYTNEMMKKRLQEADCKNGFILDGYPRNFIQADALNSFTAIDYILVLQLPDEISIERIAGRRECSKGHTYHLRYKPPKIECVCNIDGLPLKQREDEAEPELKRRLKIYHTETEHLIELYRKQHIPLLEIDGKPRIEEVSNEIRRQLGIETLNNGETGNNALLKR